MFVSKFRDCYAVYSDALSLCGRLVMDQRLCGALVLTLPSCLGGVGHQGFKLIKLPVCHMLLGARLIKVTLSNLK